MASINASSTLYQPLRFHLKPTSSPMIPHVPQSHLLFPLQPTQVDFAAVKLLDLKGQHLVKVPQQAQVHRQSGLTPILSTLPQLARRHLSLSLSSMISVLASQLVKATHLVLPILLRLVSASFSDPPLNADRQLGLTPIQSTLSLPGHQLQSQSLSLMTSLPASQRAKEIHLALHTHLSQVSANYLALPQLDADNNRVLQVALPAVKEPRTHPPALLPRRPLQPRTKALTRTP
jgi:hypothetical protein